MKAFVRYATSLKLADPSTDEIISMFNGIPPGFSVDVSEFPVNFTTLQVMAEYIET